MTEELEQRVEAVEKAIIQINHASEKFLEWKGEVSSDLRWLKYLVGVGAAAGLFSAIAEIVKAFK